MEKIKLNNIHSKYPQLFEETTSISCGNGWYWLIDNLCEQINNYVDREKRKINITYIKEKFGVLSVYIDGDTDDKIWSYVTFATHLSSKICEECGSTKYMGTTSRWIRHLCVDCGEKNRNEWTPDEGVMKEIRKDKLLKIEKND